jgi:hypothetical protein
MVKFRDVLGMSAEEMLSEGFVDGDDFDDEGFLDYEALPEPETKYRPRPPGSVAKPAPVQRVNVDDGDDDDEIKF